MSDELRDFALRDQRQTGPYQPKDEPDVEAPDDLAGGTSVHVVDDPEDIDHE